MKVPATFRPTLLFVPYALAVWVTGYQGLHGDDVLGLICAVLLLGGLFVLVYVGFFRRTISSGLASPVAAVALGLLGLALGTMSSGEASVGIVSGLVIGGGAASAMLMSARRRWRRPKTIFLSYRRADSGDITPNIRDRLGERFGASNIFMDLDSIELGGDFRAAVSDAVNHADALVVVIGRDWLGAKDEEGKRRIDRDDDLVRIEVETALRKKSLLVVPLAVKEARIPEPGQLPASIRDLASRNGGVVRSPPNFEPDMARLIRSLEHGSVTPWSRAAPVRIAWRWVAAMTAIVLVPLAAFLLDPFTRDYRAMTSADLSPDRTMVATAHGVGLGVRSRVRIWDTKTGETLHTVLTGEDPVWSVAWSPDGKYLAYGNHAGTLTILGADDWQERGRFEGHSGLVRQIAWAPDSDRVATGDDDGAIRVWSVRTGTLLFTANAHTDNIEMVAWSLSGDRIASASWDRTVAVTDGATGKLLYRVDGYASFVTSVSWSSDGTMIAAASLEAPHLRIWRDDQPAALKDLVGHNTSVDAVAWSPAGLLLASAGRDQSVRVWNVSGAVERVLNSPGTIGAPDLGWSPDGKRLAISGDETLSVWDMDTGRLLRRVEAHPDDYDVRIVGWWPDGRTLVTRGSYDGVLKTWDLDQGQAAATMSVGIFTALMDMMS